MKEVKGGDWIGPEVPDTEVRRIGIGRAMEKMRDIVWRGIARWTGVGNMRFYDILVTV